MRRYVVGMLLGTVMTGSFAGVGYAQLPEPALFAAEGRQGSPASRAASEQLVLERRVAIDIRDWTLDAALAELARQSGVDIMYSKAVLPRDHRVSLRGTSLPLKDALNHVLRGTGASARVTEKGQIVVSMSGSGTAQMRQGTVVGKVINSKTRQPIAGATIVIAGVEGNVVTAQDGTFRVMVSAGEHAVQVRSLGMVRVSRRVTVVSDQTVTLEVTMEPSASVLDEVIVTGTVVATARKEIPTPITVIKAEDIERRGITRLEELFRGEVPGLLVLEEGTRTYSNIEGSRVTSSIYARGSSTLTGSANPIKTYIDGVELLDPSYLGTIDPRSIERIEIVTGPQAATIYGSGAMGGVMQIFTKVGLGRTVPELTLHVKYGMLENNFSQGRTPRHDDMLSISGGAGPVFSYSGNLSYGYTGQWQPALFERRMGASIGMTHKNGPFTVSGSVGTLMSRNGTFRSDGLFAREYGVVELFNTGQIQPMSGGAASFRSSQVSTTTSQTLALNIDFQATQTWAHHLTIGKNHQRFVMHPEAPAFSRLGGGVGADSLYAARQSMGERTSVSYNTSWIPNTFGFIVPSLTVGASGAAGGTTRIVGCLAAENATTLVGCKDAGVASNAPSVGSPKGDRSMGVFSSLRLGFFNQLFFSFGLRADRNPAYGKDLKLNFTPTNGATYAIEFGDVTLKLLGSYGRATRAPDAAMRDERLTTLSTITPSVWIDKFANAQLRPEYSQGPQGGIEFYYGNRGSFSLNHYQQTVTDLIMEIPVDSFWGICSCGSEFYIPQTQHVNVGKMRQLGWEGTLALNLGAFSVKSSASWNDSRVLVANRQGIVQGGVAFAPGAAFSGVPTHTANVVASYAYGPSSVVLSVNRVGASIGKADDQWILEAFGRMRMYRNRRITTAPDVHRPGYVKSDLAVSHRLYQNVTATLNIMNATNNFGSEMSALEPSLGRQTLLGLRVRLSGNR